MKAIITLLTISMLAQSARADDPPKIDPRLLGTWELKSVTVNGKAATATDLSGLLKDFGGLQPGMSYKFRDDGFASFNDTEVLYDYLAQTKELKVICAEDGKNDSLYFAVKFTGKNIVLRHKEKNKTVVMTFALEQ